MAAADIRANASASTAVSQFRAVFIIFRCSVTGSLDERLGARCITHNAVDIRESELVLRFRRRWLLR